MANPVVVVLGSPFADVTPERRKAYADEIVTKAIGRAEPQPWPEFAYTCDDSDEDIDEKPIGCGYGDVSCTACEAPNYSLRDALKIAYERIGETMPSERFHVNIGGEVRAVEPEPADPMERMVDGLTVAECLERFTAWQREGSGYGGGTTTYWIDGVRHVRPWSLDTHAQVAAAREAWSAALRAKQEEARERERRQIVCDDDRWEVG